MVDIRTGKNGPADSEALAMAILILKKCCIKDAEQGAIEGALFVESHLITTPEKSFDDFAGTETDKKRNRKILGLE